MNVQSITRYLIIALAVLAAPPILADEDPIEADEDPIEAEEEPIEIEKTVVTGSRLKGGDPTARILTITSEDIAKRGLSSIEEIIRTIPQIFSSNNSTNSMNFTSFAADDEQGPMAFAFSSANLRGFGSANTLVLMNGRRIAGAAIIGVSITDFANNLRNLPAGIIDRVEVNLDGGSSVYGSDGVAGVINIITRKDFTGGRATIRREQSSTGANQSQLSGYFGKHWMAAICRSISVVPRAILIRLGRQAFTRGTGAFCSTAIRPTTSMSTPEAGSLLILAPLESALSLGTAPST